MPDYENYEARAYERIVSIENSDEENQTMPEYPTMEELNQLPEFQDDEELEDETDLDDFDEDYDEEDEPEDAIPAEHDKVLSFEEILAVDDDAEDDLYIPEWGGKIVVRGLSKNEFDFLRKQANRRDARGRKSEILEKEIIIAGMVKPPVNRANYELLKEKSAGVMVRILNEIYRKSGLEEEAERARERRFPKK